MRGFYIAAVVLYAAFACGFPAVAQDEPTTTKGKLVVAPDGAIAPDVAYVKNVLHMVYGLQNDAYYVKSLDQGKTFSAPVKLNGDEGVMASLGERGPKLAVGRDNIIHVVWLDQEKPGVEARVRYTRSVNRGRSFEAPQALSTGEGADGATVASDGAGHVVVFWHLVDGAAGVPEASRLYIARSGDAGKTFGKGEAVTVAGHSGLASARCQMRARLADDGVTVFLAFRSAEQGNRDIFVLKGLFAENNFTAIRGHQANWKSDTSPQCGAELTIDGPNNRPLLAFMSFNRVYWTFADKELKNGFGQPMATPARQNNEVYPTAVVNKKAEVLLVWQVGPIAATGTATVKWAVFNLGGMLQRQGTLGAVPAGTKPTAFVGSDDNFYMVAVKK